MKPANITSNLFVAIGLAILALIAIPSRTFAQNDDSLAWTFAQLRGTWEYRTFEDKFTIDFRDDNNMIFDREPATYALTESSFSVNDGDNTTRYSFSIEKNSLAVTLPDGTVRTYTKEDAGKAEELLTGNFYAAADPSRPNVTINFDGNGTFALGTEGETTASDRYGMYRIQGSRIIMAFEDGSVKEAFIQVRNGDESIVRFTYLKRDFESANMQELAENPDPGPGPVTGDPILLLPTVPAPIIVITSPVYPGGGYVPTPVSIAPSAPTRVSAPPRSERGSTGTSTPPPAPARDFGSVRTGHR